MVLKHEKLDYEYNMLNHNYNLHALLGKPYHYVKEYWLVYNITS